MLKFQTKAKITYNLKDWPSQDLFELIQKKGNISDKEMFSTFNCGVGMVIALKEKEVREALHLLNNSRIQAQRIGSVELKKENESSVEIILKK